MARHKNQYKHELPPLEMIQDLILVYWKMRWPVNKIWKTINKEHLDQQKYSIGLTRFREYTVAMGLEGTRTQKHTPDSIKPIVEELRAMYPKAGILEMKSLLFHERDIAVSKHVLMAYFQAYEPELIKKRKARNLKRKQFYSAGVNDIWAFDQHDKWKYKFGMAFHLCLDPFSGVLKWCKIWWTNSNPVLIVSYYFEVVKRDGVICLVTQSDMGTENVGIANAHTVLRQSQDPSLAGTIQHRYMWDKKNIMPEIEWSQLRRRWTPGFEDLLDIGVRNGWYSVENTLESLVFRWVFIPYLQAELDLYRNRRNLCSKRHDKNKVLPHGVPAHIEMSPQDYDAVNFALPADLAQVETVEKIFAPSDHPVFQLVPPSFEETISFFYNELGAPVISRSNVWDVYNLLLARFRQDPGSVSAQNMQEWDENVSLARDPSWGNDAFEKMPGEPLIEVEGYLGGVNGGAGPAGDGDSSDEDGEIPMDNAIPIQDEPDVQIEFDSDNEDFGVGNLRL